MSQRFRKRRILLSALVAGAFASSYAHSEEPISIVPRILPSITEAASPVLEDEEFQENFYDARETVENAELLQQRYPNGAVHIERYVTEDSNGNLVNNGSYRELDPKGVALRMGEYRLGKLEGKWSQLLDGKVVRALVETLDSGFKAPFSSEATFVNGQLEGHWAISDSQGRPVLFWQFANGQRENVSTWFDSKGNAILEVNYVAGVPHGPATISYRDRKGPEKVVFDQGRVLRLRTDWYDSHSKSKKKIEETLLVPAGHAVKDHSWWDSTLTVLPVDSKEAVRHGTITTWHSNGQKTMEGSYKLGKPHGEFQWWYSNGQPQGSGNFAEGKMNGRWVWWHTNGMKMMEGTYLDDQKEGLWSSWDQDGKIQFRGSASELESSTGTVASDNRAEPEVTQDDAEQLDRRAQLPSTQHYPSLEAPVMK